MKSTKVCRTCNTEVEVRLGPTAWRTEHVLGGLSHEPSLPIVTELERLMRRMRNAELALEMGGPSAFVGAILLPVVDQLIKVSSLLDQPENIGMLPAVEAHVDLLVVDSLVNGVDVPDDLSGLEQ